MFEGGFLGLDNVGPFDRSAALPVAGRLEQSDGTAWMAMYALNLLEMALVLAEHDRVLRGPGHQVLRALRVHRRAPPTTKGCGTTEDGVLLRRAAPARRQPGAAAGALGGRAAAAGRTPRRSAPRPWPGCRSWPPGCAWFLDQQAGVRRRDRCPPTVSARPAAPAAVHGRPGPAGTDPAPDARRGGVPLTVRAAHAVAQLPGRAVHSDLGGQTFTRRLRAGGVHQRHFRRQLELARADLVPGQLPHHRSAAASSPGSSATT